MPKLSTRGNSMPESPIRKLAPFADLAKEKGHKVYHLNIGQPDIKSPEIAINAIKNIQLDIIEYGPSAGYESYRKKLAQFYTKQNVNVNPEDILITTGGSEALLFALGSIMDPEDELIIPEPFYANYSAFAAESAAKVVPVNSGFDTGFELPSIADFEKLITPKSKAILICNPNNPTGYLYSESEILQLGELAKKYDLFLIADEVYREFIYGDDIHYSVMNLKEVEQNVIMIDSVSKRYSMCGARIGALISKNKEVMSAALKFGQARLSPPTIDQIASEAALQTPQSYFDDVVAEYVERRNIMVDGLNSIPGVFCPKPSGAFYCVAKFPVDDAEKFCQWLLEDFSHEGQTVMMAPANGFYSTPGSGQQEARIAYVLNKESLKKAVECLDAALKVYPGRI